MSLSREKIFNAQQVLKRADRERIAIDLTLNRSRKITIQVEKPLRRAGIIVR